MRIIAGKFKGRKLLRPPGASSTRPITSIAKKSLFDMLAGVLEEATVMDLYCGTGTLGLEALSRGARQCVFADRDPKVLDRLKRNIANVGTADQCTIWKGDVSRDLRKWLEKWPGCIDLAFVDPPYTQSEQWNFSDQEERIFKPIAERLAPDGIVVLRTSPKLKPRENLSSLTIRRTKRYGGTLVNIYGH